MKRYRDFYHHYISDIPLPPTPKKFRAENLGQPLATFFTPYSTMTNTETQRNRHGNPGGTHNDISYDHETIILNSPKPLYMPLGKWKLLNQTNGTVVTSEGLQSVTEVLFLNTQKQMIGDAIPLLATPELYELKNNVFDMNPYQNIIGGGTVASQERPKSDQIYIHNIHCCLEIVSASNANQTLDIYLFTPKQFSENGPKTSWINALDYEDLENAAAANPITYVDATSAGAPTILNYGNSPMGTKHFRKKWRCLSHKTVYLQPGGVHKHWIKVKVNKVINKGLLLDNASNAQNMNYPNLTVCGMIVARGQPVIAKPNAEFKATTTAKCEFGWICTQHWTFSSLGASRVEYSRANLHYCNTETPVQKIIKSTDNEDNVDNIFS